MDSCAQKENAFLFAEMVNYPILRPVTTELGTITGVLKIVMELDQDLIVNEELTQQQLSVKKFVGMD